MKFWYSVRYADVKKCEEKMVSRSELSALIEKKQQHSIKTYQQRMSKLFAILNVAILTIAFSNS